MNICDENSSLIDFFKFKEIKSQSNDKFRLDSFNSKWLDDRLVEHAVDDLLVEYAVDVDISDLEEKIMKLSELPIVSNAFKLKENFGRNGKVGIVSFVLISIFCLQSSV